MSRGLGKLQRAILDTLDEAKMSGTIYRGVSWYHLNLDAGTAQPGWVTAHGCEVQLAPHVYDLRASMQYLARRLGGMDRQWVSESFQASFSRAVRTLARRGLLKVYDFMVPIQVVLEGADANWLMDLADGQYLRVTSHQKRFVSVNHI